jgi:hypothetical protein
LSDGEPKPPIQRRTAEEMRALLLENLKDAPVVYADGYQGVTVSNGVVKINFFQDLFDPSANKNVRTCSVVLALSLPALAAVRTHLNQLVNQLEEQGLIVVQDTGQKTN